MRYLLSLLLFTWVNVRAQDALEIPALTSPVMDQAQFLSQAQEKDLTDLIYEIHTNQGPQITILTVPDLQGYPIEEYSIRVAEKWQLGTRKAGNGLLVIISKAERAMRIEVGEGIEGEITDYDTALFTRDVFPRYFREGDFHGGLRLFIEDVAGRFNIKLSGASPDLIRRAPRRHTSTIFDTILPFLVLVLVMSHLLMRRRPFGRGVMSGAGMAAVGWAMLPGIGLAIIVLFFLGFVLGMAGVSNLLFGLASGRGRYGGGGFGGGGFGGGGWGGGGGGFSGGGSSGRW